MAKYRFEQIAINKTEKKNNSQKSGKQQCSNANNIGKGKKSAKSK